jgi:beta-glucanase (GH16 family)
MGIALATYSAEPESRRALFRKSLLCAAAIWPMAAAFAAPPPHSTWKLTFFDEFDGTSLDLAKWSNGYALNRTGPGSWADPGNVRIANGSLKLYGEKRAGEGKSFAGAAILNKGKFRQMYGYMEARIKVPEGKGFSAKMTGIKADGGYPPWLDIIETRGEEPEHPYWIIHAGGKEAGGGWNGTDMVREYHTLGTEWTADEFIFYVDGVVKLRDRTLAPICRMEMCWALELMVGGDAWIGIPDAGTPWPGIYEVDYVRIYSRQGPATVRLSDPHATEKSAPATAKGGRLVTGRWREGGRGAAPVQSLCGADGCGAAGLNPAR